MSLNIKNKLAGLAVSALLISAINSQAIAADEKAMVFVDTQVILEKSTALVKVREQLDKKAEEFKKDSTNKEAYFKKKYEDLEKQKAVLTKEVFEQKNNELAKEFGEAQKKVQESRGTLDKAYTEAMQHFEKVLTEIVKEEAIKNHAKAVLPKMQALYSDDSLDITAPILESLNKKLPNIAVKF
ncbi:MAG: ompH family outer membrane protein [Candidatus Midichloriaceae bacterium]|jgi:Skp family chaperone for outer membrane proteins|nr:ompH family outer membrane protein [Candidatus Midichloriaceae bacterium]